jgi:nucleolar protein 9
VLILVATARTSVLQALVDRAGVLGDCQNAVLDLIISALDLPETDQIALVPCLMVLKTFPTYQALITGTSPPVQPADALDPDAEAAARMEGWKNRRQPKRDSGGLTPNMQGCLLLQALVKLPSTNEVLDSLLAQEVSTLLEYAKHSIASHFLDAALTSPSVLLRYRRQLISTFLGHYAELAQDRVGSRVADTIWAAADGYMREKIARTLIPEATILGNSEYGRFFVRKLDLWGLERRPEEWRDAQLGVKARPGRTSARAINGHQDSEEGMKEKEKRKEMGDEIDELFAGVEKKRRKV